MSPFKKAHFAADRTYFIEFTAIWANLVYSNHVTNNFLDHLLRDLRNVILIFWINVCKMFINIVFNGIHLFFAGHFISIADSFFHLSLSVFVNGFYNISWRFFFDKFLLRNTDLWQEAELEFYDLFDFFMSEHDCVEDIRFWNFLRTAFDHEDGITRTSHTNIHIALFALFHRRVDNEFTIDTANANTGNRAGKRNMRHA